MGQIIPFFLAVLEHWATLVTGGVVMAIIAYRDSIDKPVKKIWIRRVFSLFLVVAFFQAWSDESQSRKNAELECKNLKKELDYNVKRATELSDALNKSKASSTNPASQTLAATNIVGSAVFQGNSNSISITTSYRDTNAENNEKKAAMEGYLRPPTDSQGFTISLGGQLFKFPSGLIFVDGNEPLLWITNKNGKLLVSANIFDEKGDLIAELRENEWQLNKALIFTRNYNDSALEVCKTDGKVVLQLVSIDNVINFLGILRCKNGAVFSVSRTEDGALIAPWELNIPKIFEYPAGLHFGSCPGCESFKSAPVPAGTTPRMFLITQPLNLNIYTNVPKQNP